jgi:hypothetical protein
MTEPTSCQSSRQAGEPIYGTATEASIWICLEYRGPWERKAFQSSRLPERLKTRLDAALQASPTARLQFVRRPGRTRGPLSLYLAKWDPDFPQAHRLDFEDYGQLAKLDLSALAAGHPPAGAHREDRPWVLICGNGRRDFCCALHGVASYRAVAGRLPAEVWLSDHQGGHRFAGNGLILPAGLHLGRLAPSNARRVLKGCLQGAWDFEHIRGHAAYPPAAQAGEHFLRQQLGLTRLNDLRFVAAVAGPPGTWEVRFRLIKSAQERVVRIEEHPSDFEVLKTTGDPAPARISVFDLA